MENKNIIESIFKEVVLKNIRFGEVTITLSYHDARITKYSLSTSETHNLPMLKKVVKKEAVDAKN